MLARHPSSSGTAMARDSRQRGPEDLVMIGRHFVWRYLTAGLIVAAAANVLSAKQAPAQESRAEKVSPLFQTALPNVEGKTFTSVIVEFPPAARAAPHRHGAAFVYAPAEPARGRADPYLPGGRELVRAAGRPPRAHGKPERDGI